MNPQNLRGVQENMKHTLLRSVSLNPRDISLFRSSRINSITVFGSMKAVEDMSATRQNKYQTGSLDKKSRIQPKQRLGKENKTRQQKKTSDMFIFPSKKLPM